MRKQFLSVVLVLLALASSNAIAFDQDRSGFLIGFGGGAHSTSSSVSVSSDFVTPNDDVSDRGAAISFKIGGGLNRKTTVYFLSLINVDSDAAHGLTGLGGSYYFKASGPTFYLNGGIGFGTVVFPDSIFEDDDEGAVGGAALFGVGFSPVQGLHLDLNVMTIQAEDSTTFNGVDIDYDITSAQFLIGYTWF